MTGRNDPPLDVANLWLESSINLGLMIRFSGTSTDTRWSLHFQLLQMGRLQFAVDLSFQRLIEAHQEIQSMHEGQSALMPIFRLSLELHSFLVSSHAYWQTLEELGQGIRLDALAESVTINRNNARATKTARNHIEHVTERIKQGRSKGHGADPMDPQTFWKAMGQFDGRTVTFGDEAFDLSEIYNAIRKVGESVAPALQESSTPTIQVIQADPSTDTSQE